MDSQNRICKSLLVALLFGVLNIVAVGQTKAQSSGQSAAEPLEMRTQKGRVVKMKPGARLALYGPVGTKAIKGRLVTAGDTIILENKKAGKRFAVPEATVTAVRRYRIGFQVIAGYYAYQLSITVILMVVLINDRSPFANGGLAIAALLPSLLFLTGILWLFSWLGARKYNLSKWKIQKK